MAIDWYETNSANLFSITYYKYIGKQKVIKYACPICDYTYDWDYTWDDAKKAEVKAEVDAHHNDHIPETTIN